MTKTYDFAAGPASLPGPVLEHISQHVASSNILSMSHRSAAFEDIRNSAEAHIRTLLSINEDDDYAVLFLQGGGTGQFAATLMNLVPQSAKVDYIVTGTWSKKASQEAKQLGYSANAHTFKNKFPDPSTLSISEDAEAIYFCDNETVDGIECPTRYHQTLADLGKPLIADMSSNIFSRAFDVRHFACIFAGAQKNLGVAGLTIVVVRRDLLQRSATTPMPSIFDYSKMDKENSLLNTPNCFAIWVTQLVLDWLNEKSLEKQEEENQRKASRIYRLIDDEETSIYQSPVSPESRSSMNIVFRVKGDEALEKTFIAEAAAKGLTSLAGHRSVGGIRASLYNAVTQQAVEALAAFMIDFAARHA